MGQVLHGRARTTAAVRRALRQRRASLSALAARHAINPKTVAQWRKRTAVEDAPLGPQGPRPAVLTPEQEAACVACRKRTLLPLDDGLDALRVGIPGRTRSSPHRCFQRHGSGRLPDVARATPSKKVFRTYPLGSCHVVSAAVRTEAGKRSLFVAIDRTARFASAALLPRAGTLAAVPFLRDLVAAVPDTIHTVRTDNGVQCTNRQGARLAFVPSSDRVCREHGIAHRLTEIAHPWTNGQVGRMERTRKEAPVSRYRYATHQQPREHLYNSLNAYNCAKRRKTRRGLAPSQHTIGCWQREPQRFHTSPHHHTLGLRVRQRIT